MLTTRVNMRTTLKTWRGGQNTMVVTIPRNIRQLLNIDIGDTLEVDMINILKPKQQTQNKNASQQKTKITTKQ